MRNESSSYQTATWTAVVWALGVLIVGSYAPWASALEMYLEIDNVKGEVTADGHVDAIEVLAWSWGVKSSVSVTPGQPRKLGPTEVQDLSATKYQDLASAPLLLGVLRGDRFPSATLFVVKQSLSNPKTVLRIKMTDVLITSVSTGGAGGEERLTENITLNFATVEFRYEASGPHDGEIGEARWDIQNGELL